MVEQIERALPVPGSWLRDLEHRSTRGKQHGRAIVTCAAAGLVCTAESWAGPVEAGLHPAAGDPKMAMSLEMNGATAA